MGPYLTNVLKKGITCLISSKNNKYVIKYFIVQLLANCDRFFMGERIFVCVFYADHIFAEYCYEYNFK